MAGAKVLNLKQLLAKKYEFLPDLPEDILRSFGTLTKNFIMIIWGHSGNGKTNLLVKLLKVLMNYGKVLYVSLEEGHEASMQLTALRHLSMEHSGKISFADDSMTYDELVIRLKRKKSEQFIVIDSVQYWDIDYNKYKQLKLLFKNKTFIFVSHACGKLPDGKTAIKIRYDAAIKVHVDNYIAFIKSRLGGNKNFVIWEEGARKYYGKKFKAMLDYKESENETVKKQPKKKKEEVPQEEVPTQTQLEL